MTLSRRTLVFAIVAAAQVVFPLAMVGYNEVRIAQGKEILLRVEPVDPHDLFRGEYVALSYGISRLGRAYEPGTTVYVPLFERSDGSWAGARAQTDRPDAGTFIRGRTREFGAEYGIETYYVQEGQARTYESAAGAHRLYARVSLRGDGSAKLKGLVIR